MVKAALGREREGADWCGEGWKRVNVQGGERELNRARARLATNKQGDHHQSPLHHNHHSRPMTTFLHGGVAGLPRPPQRMSTSALDVEEGARL